MEVDGDGTDWSDSYQGLCVAAVRLGLGRCYSDEVRGLFPEFYSAGEKRPWRKGTGGRWIRVWDTWEYQRMDKSMKCGLLWLLEKRLSWQVVLHSCFCANHCATWNPEVAGFYSFSGFWVIRSSLGYSCSHGAALTAIAAFKCKNEVKYNANII